MDNRFERPLEMSASEAMRTLRVCRRTLKNMAKNGIIRIAKKGGGRGVETLYAIPRGEVPNGWGRA